MKMKKILASLLALAMIATLVPFAAFAEDDTSFVFGTSYGSFNNSRVPVYQLGGLGGKAADDTAFAFVYEGEEPTTDVTRWYYPITHLDETVYKSSGDGPSAHFAFNIYADGGAIARFSYNDSYDFFLWNPDGTLNYSAGGTPSSINLARGQWHRIAVALNNNAGGRFALYVDGVKLTDKADAGWGANIDAKKNLVFGIAAGSTSGVVAYDDPMVGFAQSNAEKYDKTILRNDAALVEDSSYLTIDSSAKTISIKKLITDFDVFANAVMDCFTNESEVRFFNSDMTAEVSTVDEAKVAIVKTVNNAYVYYTIAEYELTNIDIVGLAKEPDDTSVASDNWKANIQIVDNSKVAVYSSALRNLSCVDSTRLISGLVSNNGYELSYVDADKNPASSASVEDGYIKAVKEGSEDIYIEIVDKYNYVGTLEFTDLTADKRGATLTSASGVAGKDADDVSHGYAGTTYTGTTASQKQAKYYHSADEVISLHPNGTRTYVFNMYVDGDANANIGVMHGTNAYYIMKWDGATGNLYGPSTGTATGDVSYLNLATGRWHQVAMSMDKGTGGRLEIYIDGVLYERVITENLGWNNYTGIALGTYVEATSGMVLYDDIEIYNGFYDKDLSAVAHKASSDKFAIDTQNKVIYYKDMASVADLTSAAVEFTTASSARAYADATLAAEATEINADTVVQLKSPDGLRFEHYTLKAYSELPAPQVSIVPSITTFDVKLNIASNADDYICYVASFDDAGKLVMVKTIDVTEDMVYNTYSKKFAYGDGGVSAKVFLWKNGVAPVAFDEADAEMEEPLL